MNDTALDRIITRQEEAATDQDEHGKKQQHHSHFTTIPQSMLEGHEMKTDADADAVAEQQEEEQNDFGDLAALYPPLAPHLIPIPHLQSSKPRYRLDWRNAEAVGRLTESLLFARFNLRVSVPTDQLIPAIPLRLNYITWIEQLVARSTQISTSAGAVSTSSSSSSSSPLASHPDLPIGNIPPADVVGVDVGCGPVAVYALLGAARNSNWRFICSDIDPISLQRAEANAKQNPSISDRLSFALQPDSSCILRNILTADSPSKIDFCMFNPPFFATADEKRDRSDTTCTATTSELVHEQGGEMGLFLCLMRESVMPEFRMRLTWFTFMFGIKRHLKEASRLLQQANVPFVVKKSFIQGKTRRWAVGWSFQPWLVTSSSASPAPLVAAHTSVPLPAPAPKRRKLAEPLSMHKIPRFRDIVANGRSLRDVFHAVERATLALNHLLVFKKSPSMTNLEFIQSTMDQGTQQMILLPVRIEFVAPPVNRLHNTQYAGHPSVIVKLNIALNLPKRESASRDLSTVPEADMLQAFANFASSVAEALS